MDAIAHTQVSGFCLVTLAVLLRAQQKMRDKSLPGRLFTALLWFAGALTIVDYGSALAQLGAWEELGIPMPYRLNAGGSILFYLLAACCCQLVFLYVEAELGRTWMEDGRRRCRIHRRRSATARRYSWRTPFSGCPPAAPARRPPPSGRTHR